MINWNVMLLNLFTGVGVETEGLIKTQQQIEEEQQMAMGQEVAMQAVKEGGDETNG